MKLLEECLEVGEFYFVGGGGGGGWIGVYKSADLPKFEAKSAVRHCGLV
jgi:hypothetical protein